MVVQVTRHAIKRYRERMFDYSSSEESIKVVLIQAALQGKRVQMRPSAWGKCVETKYNGFSVVLNYHDDQITVVTCLGGKCYRKWIKSQDSYSRVRGRVLHPNMLFNITKKM